MISRRTTATLASCLVAGAAATILVSWACALWASMPAGPFTPDENLKWPVPVPTTWEAHPSLAFHGRTPCWRIDGLNTRVTAVNSHILYVWETGWPWRAMRAVQAEEYGAAPPVRRWSRGAVVFSSTMARRLGTFNDALPLRPRPLAFAGDTLVYGSLVWTLLAAGRGVHRRLRRHRGACPSCGYSLAGLAEGSACPECGRAST